MAANDWKQSADIERLISLLLRAYFSRRYIEYDNAAAVYLLAQAALWIIYFVLHSAAH